MMADANLEKWSSALSLLSTASVPTASLLCSKMYQSSKTFLFYSQGATNTYCVSQQTPAIQTPSCKAVCPVAQTLPYSQSIWDDTEKAPRPHLQVSVRFLMLPHSEKIIIPQDNNYQWGNIFQKYFWLLWSKKLHFSRHHTSRSQVSLAECF